jgi:cyclopropane-fatty-acyl-phospholipid synthase
VLQKLLEGQIKSGRLVVRLADGRDFRVGEGDTGHGPDVTVQLHGRSTPLKLALNPELYLGEAYMNGDLVLERGSLWDLMELIGRNCPPRVKRRAIGTPYGRRRGTPFPGVRAARRVAIS